jgi:hypothetical protein
MNAGSHSSRTDGSVEMDRELMSKLFSAGFTILGISFPVLAGALVALRDPGISTSLARGLRGLVWLLLPAVVICAAQSLFCLGVITGFFKKPRLAVLMTFVLIAYMMSSILIWALVSVLG